MTDAALSLMTAIYAARARGDWMEQRGSNFLDGGAYYYGIYETKDGKHLAVGAIEEKFRRLLFERLGIDTSDVSGNMDRSRWGPMKAKLASIIQTKTREEWEQIFNGSDACVAPVLSMSEAMRHPHNVARGAFVQVAGVEQPAPAPRFSRTPAMVQAGPVAAGEHSGEILRELGLQRDEIQRMEAEGIVRGTLY